MKEYLKMILSIILGFLIGKISYNVLNENIIIIRL